MEDIIFRYDDPIDTWYKQVKEALDKNGVIYNDVLINNIIKSLCDNINIFIKQLNHKPKDSILYRSKILNNLNKYGLDITIKTNIILWKYLEYFTDIEDYSKCFDIYLSIKNPDLVYRKEVILKAKGLDLFIYKPIYSESYNDLQYRINNLKNKIDNYQVKDVLKILLDIISDLNLKGE